MSNILAIDTSTDACSVALLTSPSDTKPDVHQSLVISPREHTQRLLPMVESLLAEHTMSLSQLDGIAFGVGPGSFTGLRIALSTAQGLAFGADLPLIPISTLQTMAQTAYRLGVASTSSTIIPVIDARMNEVYWSSYQFSDELAQVLPISDEVVAAPDSLAKHRVLTSENICAVGSGWHYDVLQDVLQDVMSTSVSDAPYVTIKQDCYPEAYDVAVLAQVALANQQVTDPLSAVPTYIRDEVSWKKRQRIRDVS